MPTLKAQQAGGRASAKKSREKALTRYYANPQHCRHCASVIPVPEGKKVAEVRRKKFCDRSCAAAFNNRGVSRHGSNDATFICTECKSEHEKPRRKNRKKGRYDRKICDRCLPGLASRRAKTPRRTKGELYARSKNWQSANSTIRQLAREAYRKNGRPQKCAVCQYHKHVQVCHVRDVADFPDEALISEINAVANLVALCPTHHWEFGNDALDAPDRAAVEKVLRAVRLPHRETLSTSLSNSIEGADAG